MLGWLIAASLASPHADALQSPFVIRKTTHDGAITVLETDDALEQLLRSTDEAMIGGFPLGTQLMVDMQVERFEILTPDATLLVGDQPAPRPDVALYRGVILDDPESSVFIGLTSFGPNGIIVHDDNVYVLSSGPFGEGLDPVIFNMTTLPDGVIEFTPFECLASELGGTLPDHDVNPFAPRGLPCREVEAAIETDNEFLADIFGGNQTAAMDYLTLLMGAQSGIYQDQLNSTFVIGFVRLWDAANTDPWTELDMVSQWYEMQAWWNSNMTHVDRHFMHFLSGRPLGGGAAWLGGLCETDDVDYAISANLNGFFPYPIVHNDSQNWDMFVVAHEQGHLFGAPHTHDMSPPIDGCGAGDCSVTPNGTIMSYCHLCAGGYTNIRLEFAQRMVDEAIIPFLTGLTCDTSCPSACVADWDASGIHNSADFVAYLNDYNLARNGGTPIFGNPDLAAPFGVINTADFLAYLNAYGVGCP